MWYGLGLSLKAVKPPVCLDANESGFAGASLFRQRCLAPCPRFSLTLPEAPCYLLRSCLAEGMPGLPRRRHLKGVLETSSEGKCIPLPAITLR